MKYGKRQKNQLCAKNAYNSGIQRNTVPETKFIAIHAQHQYMKGRGKEDTHAEENSACTVKKNIKQEINKNAMNIEKKH